MKFVIKHAVSGRVRIHLNRVKMSAREADIFACSLRALPAVTGVRVYRQTTDAVICYTGSRGEVLSAVQGFSFAEQTAAVPAAGEYGNALTEVYKGRLIRKTCGFLLRRALLPFPLRALYDTAMASKYLVRGADSLLKGRLDVAILDAAAVGVSILRGDFTTAGTVMYLLSVGELLEEWTHKKSVADLAESMSLHVDQVWLKSGGSEILVPISQVKEGDLVSVRVGTLIPLDGVVTAGEAMVNQTSLTGESIPVRKSAGAYVYAGTALEEGSLVISVKKAAGDTRIARIVTMIEESERLKSSVESRASRLADSLVPYSLGGTALTWLVTGSTAKALSVLMVDFSCALKLAMPLSVLAAIREASLAGITVKGGKFLEAVAGADTIIFDKTGTLTEARPTVAAIYTFDGRDENDMLRIAACLEEHFPHSIASAVVQESLRRGLVHAEMHSRVEYIVAHGIATSIGDSRAVIGSYHFVFEDEKCTVPESGRELFEHLPAEYSHLYLALGGRLAAVICIEDPLRPEASETVQMLRKAGFTSLVMMTGDSERTAAAIAARVGVDRYFSEVLPGDKAAYVEQQKQEGHTVIMVGDGINDSPALSAADVGIAISEGSEIAREISDITISANDLKHLILLRQLSTALMARIQKNYRFIISFNASLILLGICGVFAPSFSALLHNGSTLAVSLKSMTPLLPQKAA